MAGSGSDIGIGMANPLMKCVGSDMIENELKTTWSKNGRTRKLSNKKKIVNVYSCVMIH